MISICETFVSISGESTFQGLPAFFIRTGRCNLHCVWCDTSYAWEEGDYRSIDSLVTEAQATSLKLAVITGGEPLLQKNMNELIVALADLNWTVLIETNGTQPIAGYDQRARMIVDVKPPSAFAEEPFFLQNLARLRPIDELKFVIGERGDFDAAVAFIHKHDLIGKCPLLFSPIMSVLPPERVAEWILEEKLPVRLQLQLHKILWGADTKGR